MITAYHKLVRDKVPQFIKKRGVKAVTKILNDEEFLYYLKLKLKEEAGELVMSDDVEKNTEEIADVLEILDYIIKIQKITPAKINKHKKLKKIERGGFDKRIFLVLTEE